MGTVNNIALQIHCVLDHIYLGLLGTVRGSHLVLPACSWGESTLLAARTRTVNSAWVNSVIMFPFRRQERSPTVW